MFDDRELIRYQPVVRRRIAEIDQANLVAAYGAVLDVELHINAFNQGTVNSPVLFDQRRGLVGNDLLQRILPCLERDIRVETIHGPFQAVHQHHVGIGRALGRGAVRSRDAVRKTGVTEGFELVE